MNETNINLANNLSNCIVKAQNFTTQVVINICNGTEQIVPMGSFDLILEMLVAVMLLLPVAMGINLAKDIFFNGY